MRALSLWLTKLRLEEYTASRAGALRNRPVLPAAILKRRDMQRLEREGDRWRRIARWEETWLWQSLGKAKRDRAGPSAPDRACPEGWVCTDLGGCPRLSQRADRLFFRRGLYTPAAFARSIPAERLEAA